MLKKKLQCGCFEMQHSDFVHLHLHTEYSLLDGAIKIDELVEEAVYYKLPALAITDHGNLFGAVEFYRKAIKSGIKPIIGCEVYVSPGSRLDKTKINIKGLSDEASFHLVLLIKNEDGYKNLCNLVTKSYLEGFYYKPRIDKELLAQYSSGLIGLSACLKGEVSYYLGHNMMLEARNTAFKYKHILGDGNFFLELQNNGLKEQDEINKKLVLLSKETNIPVVATNDCHYLKKEDAKAHDILLCIQTNHTIKDPKRLRFMTEELYFKSPEEMKSYFKEIPEAIKNTLEIAQRCGFEFHLGQNLLPRFKPPKEITVEKFLAEISTEGLKNRFKGLPPNDYIERLKLELKIIDKMEFSSYFLIVWDFIKYAKDKKIPVGPGRGSATGSLVAYSLGITEIDPIKYNLLFERFLNPDRISMPDIDVDFCRVKRQDVINYVSEKYGKDNVSHIITFGTMAARAVVRDVGRAIDIPYPEVDKIAKLIPFGTEVKNLDNALKIEPQLKELYNSNPTIKELIDISKRLEGIARHASTHAAGIVIAPNPISNYMALYKNQSEDIITTQFDMSAVEKIGLFKFDFLGLKTLTIMDKTIQYIKNQGKHIDILNLPLDDKSTFTLLNSGETTGIFQLESSGMRDTLVKMQPNRFEDLIALVALYRPGPMAWIDDFIKNKNSCKEIKYLLQGLKEILDETYGIILYQEQVMLIANKIANFTMGQADILRKAMGKKNIEEMERQKEIFIKGAIDNKVQGTKAKELFELMEPFAKYGFNKSHSAAYAYIAYQTAYLKTHYPVEFMTANMSADMSDTDKIIMLMDESRKMAIEILPPDINKSDREFTTLKDSILFGLEAVKGVGSAGIESIIKERQNGIFKSFKDFLSRIDGKSVNKKVVENLIKAGAFDSIYKETGYSKFDSRLLALNMFASHSKGNKSENLFTNEQIQGIHSKEASDDFTFLNYEKDALGFYISGHPLIKLRKFLAQIQVSRISDFVISQEDIESGENAINKDFNKYTDERLSSVISGIVTEIKNKIKDKKTTIYITLEDETGKANVIIFSDLYKKNIEIVKKGNILLIKGQILTGEKSVKIIAREIQDLTEIEIILKYEIIFKCDEQEKIISKLKSIRKILNTGNKSMSSLNLKFYIENNCVIMATPLNPDETFPSEVQKITGDKVIVS